MELCTLNAEDPVAEEGDCASFAFVKAYTVDGQVWKNGVEVDDDDGFDLHLFEDDDPVAVPGIAVSMDPVAGRNLAGESDSHTTTEDDDDDTDVDDTVHFDFGLMADGAYAVEVTDGWVAAAGMGGDKAARGIRAREPTHREH